MDKFCGWPKSYGPLTLTRLCASNLKLNTSKNISTQVCSRVCNGSQLIRIISNNFVTLLIYYTRLRSAEVKFLFYNDFQVPSCFLIFGPKHPFRKLNVNRERKELNNLNQVPVYGDTNSVGKTKSSAFKQ